MPTTQTMPVLSMPLRPAWESNARTCGVCAWPSFGAGGVARIVAGLTDVGAKVAIYNRTVERAEELATEFGCQLGG